MDHAAGDKADASTLTGVSETALLTLNGRAHQARHPKPILDDPMAIQLVDAIDSDFDKFGRRGQEMALRSLAFDRAALHYLSDHPRATVVALAEGLQTSFWRLSSALPDAEFHWFTVDSQQSSNCACGCYPPHRGSPASRSRHSITDGWTRWTRATVSSSLPRAC